MSQAQRPRSKSRLALLLSFFLLSESSVIRGQEIKDVPAPDAGPTIYHNLPLEPARRSDLEEAIKSRNFQRAESLLVEEVQRNPKSSQLLTLLGGIFFQDGQYLNSAIAIKKAEAINPLDDNSRFTLAMAYIVLNHRDWARPELEKLAQNNSNNALYPYWLSRLDYDGHQYKAAIAKLETVVKLDSSFMRAYDNLGLAYEALGNQDEAIRNYLEAIRLNRLKSLQSPWPSLNLGAVLLKQGKADESEPHLREALEYDPRLAKAHYQSGLLLEKQGKDDEAIRQLTEAASLDPAYAEPHYALGRIYQRKGDAQKAGDALETFQKLKKEKREEPAR